MKKLLIALIIPCLLSSCSMRAMRLKMERNNEAELLSHSRQLVFGGKRSGEGYFSADGKEIVFQSEREPNNPFYQIYLMNMESGESRRISPGFGKTTCAWIHPSGQKVLFASTHADPRSRKLQKEELKFRASGKTRRYSWDYDPSYDIWEVNRNGKGLKNLTHARGYDAEGSYSPDGKLIIFASNRHAYKAKLSKADKERLNKDPSYFLDLYIMRSDGTKVKRLTTSEGYDGGAFFSPDGNRIVWRRFSPDGAKAEIYTMKVDGSDERQITHMGAMAWAPFYHPSGDYIIFTSNVQGFDNFELYMIDANGEHEPRRVTTTAGFDGLPVFSPDGNSLLWSSGRGLEKSAQLFIAQWDDSAARDILRIPQSGLASLKPAPVPSTSHSDEKISKAELKEHVTYLASDELEGRLTGTPGERKATEYAADLLKSYGFQPAGDNGKFYDWFDFSAGFSIGGKNELTVGNRKTVISKDWLPTSFSANGDFKSTPVVFAGYGIATKPTNELPEYDSYAHLPVKGKWVLALRAEPQVENAAAAEIFKGASSLRYKTMTARDKGALGIIFVAGPKAEVKEELVPLGADATLAGTSIPVLTITRELADAILAPSGKTVRELESEWIKGEPRSGFLIPNIEVSAKVDLEQKKMRGRSVVARLPAKTKSKLPAIVIGAHIDHLGRGMSSNSLARENEAHDIHHGADDNASGVAAVLEVAQQIAADVSSKKLKPQRDLIVTLWSGEELGLLGSNHFTEKLKDKQSARRQYGAYVNLDMVGRFTDKLVVQGASSSPIWATQVEKADMKVGIPVNLQEDSYLPTDSTSFYLKGVPVISQFSGLHEQYHTPRDIESLINYDGLEQISQFTAQMIAGLLTHRGDIPYVETKRPEHFGMRANLRAYLGTIPDYTSNVSGLKISGVMKGGPAEKAGLRSGDIIVKLGEKKVENIYDYTFAIEALKIGAETAVVVDRNGKREELRITPGRR